MAILRPPPSSRPTLSRLLAVSATRCGGQARNQQRENPTNSSNLQPGSQNLASSRLRPPHLRRIRRMRVCAARFLHSSCSANSTLGASVDPFSPILLLFLGCLKAASLPTYTHAGLYTRDLCLPCVNYEHRREERKSCRQLLYALEERVCEKIQKNQDVDNIS